MRINGKIIRAHRSAHPDSQPLPPGTYCLKQVPRDDKVGLLFPQFSYWIKLCCYTRYWLNSWEPGLTNVYCISSSRRPDWNFGADSASNCTNTRMWRAPIIGSTGRSRRFTSPPSSYDSRSHHSRAKSPKGTKTLHGTPSPPITPTGTELRDNKLQPKPTVSTRTIEPLGH